jgi:hypothetical protein
MAFRTLPVLPSTTRIAVRTCGSAKKAGGYRSNFDRRVITLLATVDDSPLIFYDHASPRQAVCVTRLTSRDAVCRSLLGGAVAMH